MFLSWRVKQEQMSYDQVFECNSHQFSSLHFVHYHPSHHSEKLGALQAGVCVCVLLSFESHSDLDV